MNGHRHRPWSRVVADALGVPALPPLATSGTLGARGRLSANFRDQYYGLVPAVDDDAAGPTARDQRAHRPRPLPVG